MTAVLATTTKGAPWRCAKAARSFDMPSNWWVLPVTLTTSARPSTVRSTRPTGGRTTTISARSSPRASIASWRAARLDTTSVAPRATARRNWRTRLLVPPSRRGRRSSTEMSRGVWRVGGVDGPATWITSRRPRRSSMGRPRLWRHHGAQNTRARSRVSRSEVTADSVRKQVRSRSSRSARAWDRSDMELLIDSREPSRSSPTRRRRSLTRPGPPRAPGSSTPATAPWPTGRTPPSRWRSAPAPPRG